jgi:hypothetical protein
MCVKQLILHSFIQPPLKDKKNTAKMADAATAEAPERKRTFRKFSYR